MKEQRASRGAKKEQASQGKRRVCELTVPGRLEDLATICEFVGQAAKQAGASKRTIFDIQLAVDEACTNIIEHAYSGSGGEICLRCECNGDDFEVVIQDHGQPFDPQAVAAPDVKAELDQRQEGGLGLHFMRCLMDEVRFRFDHQSNELRMVKHLQEGKSVSSRTLAKVSEPAPGCP
jgi:anti-sigma regulatory factor (Ser/Thr protein kinase)